MGFIDRKQAEAPAVLAGPPPGHGMFVRMGLDAENKRLIVVFNTGGCQSSIQLLDGVDARVVALALRELALTVEANFTTDLSPEKLSEYTERMGKAAFELSQKLQRGM